MVLSALADASYFAPASESRSSELEVESNIYEVSQNEQFCLTLRSFNKMLVRLGPPVSANTKRILEAGVELVVRVRLSSIC